MLFDVNAIYCSLENSDALKHLYPYWAWIDLAMNVFVPFTGKRERDKLIEILLEIFV